MFLNRDQKFMDMAVRLAAGNDERSGGARIGAVIAIKNRVISFGINRKKTHPFQAEYGKNNDAIELHAENDAIKNALRFIDVEELKRATLYVARVKQYNYKSDLFHGLAKPCKGCERCISTFNIKRVIYTTNEHNQLAFL